MACGRCRDVTCQKGVTRGSGLSAWLGDWPRLASLTWEGRACPGAEAWISVGTIAGARGVVSLGAWLWAGRGLGLAGSLVCARARPA